MSESAAIALIVVLDVATLGFLAWMMSHARHLRPHVSAEQASPPARFMREIEYEVEQVKRELDYTA